MSDLQDMLDVLSTVYTDVAILGDPRTVHMVVDGQTLLSRNDIPGVRLEARTEGETVIAELRVSEGLRLATPVHMCIGMLMPEGTQRIQTHVTLEQDAQAKVLAHCLFPKALKVQHAMQAEILVGPGAELQYSEGHYHGSSGGVEVIPKAIVHVEPHGRFYSDFSLTSGRVGILDIDYRVEATEEAMVELISRVFGRSSDRIRIREEVYLMGTNSRGLIKTRVAVEGEAVSEVIGITHGSAAGARGHMDCLEIIRGHACATAEPIVKVNHPLAKVTHEAAVGTVDQRQLETLMARGLTPEQAVDVLVMGMLR